MNTIKYIGLLFLGGLLFASCSDGDLITDIDARPYENYSSTNSTYVSFEQLGGNYTLSIKSMNSSWSISNLPSWLTLSSTSGNDDEDVIISAEANNSVGVTRECNLYFESQKGKETKIDTIRVQQKSITPFLTLARTDTCITCRQTNIEIPLSTNTEDWIVTNSNWITSDIVKNGENYFLKIAVAENKMDDLRSGGIEIRNTNEGENYRTWSFYIYQYPSRIDGINNGYAYVDLGLSSGTKWAFSNLGTKNEDSSGYYYCWAETTPNKNETYDIEHYEYAIKFTPDYVYMPSISYYGYTKYTLSTENLPYRYNYKSERVYDTPDKKKMLEDKDNAVKARLGSFWDMPTVMQYEELITECTWEWTSLNGYKVTGPNGKSIFFKACGVKKDKEVEDYNSKGVYWLKEITDLENCYGRCLYFDQSAYNKYVGYLRYRGGNIRAVVAK